MKKKKKGKIEREGQREERKREKGNLGLQHSVHDLLPAVLCMC